MSTYNINFTDPLQSGFQILPGVYNGPGSADPASSLRLYGRGAHEWGEAVNEDLLRQLQSYASATPPQLRTSNSNDPSWLPPVNALAGQLWFRWYLYQYSTGTSRWWRYEYDSTTDTWIWTQEGTTWQINIVDTSLGPLSDPLVVPPTLRVLGNYIFDINTDRLYRWDTLYNQFAATWIERTWEQVLVDPGVSTLPKWELLVWNGGPFDSSGSWKVPKASTASATPPSNPELGDLWYDTSGSPAVLRIWNGTSWEAVNETYNDARYVLKAGDTMTGDLAMGANKVTSSAVPTIGDDLTNKTYVDAEVAAVLATVTGSYLALAGGTMTGTLTLNPVAQVGANDAATIGYVNTQIATVTATANGALRPDPGTVGSPSAPKYYFSTSAPSGGNDGDVWFQYIP